MEGVIEVIKETKTILKDQILNYLNDEIQATKKQLKNSFESCDKNYYSGCLDELGLIKSYVESI